MAIIVTDGVPYPDERRQPAIDVAARLRREDGEGGGRRGGRRPGEGVVERVLGEGVVR